MYETQDVIDGCTGGALVVNIGGNQGDDLEKSRLARPSNRGNLLLEDMAVVLKKTICDAEIRRITHNFFYPQRIRGARAYYMHGILHNWNDDDALTILIHIKNAMTPGYSKLLVDHIMMPNCGPTRLQTSVDVQTMVMTSAGRGQRAVSVRPSRK
jgi:hypothetical protein